MNVQAKSVDTDVAALIADMGARARDAASSLRVSFHSLPSWGLTGRP